MKRRAIVGGIGLLLLAVLFIGLPWLNAYRSYICAGGSLGIEEGKQLMHLYVDKTHFEAYKAAIWFDGSLSFTGKDGVIYCNGKHIAFPKGKNVALVRGAEDIIFVTLGQKYFKEDSYGSEIYYVFGRVPHFKEKNKGVIDLKKVEEDRVIHDEWASFLPVSTPKWADQPSAAPDADKPGR